jgi:hypothetical protein
MPLPPAIEAFISDIRADLGPEVADKFTEAVGATDIEASVFLTAIEWVVRHKDRSVQERLDMVERLLKLDGYSEIDMRKFTGWE